ncbi:MAG TPA: nucleoside phosphorylase [Cyclobacteriaceae bacterium]|nr:nucleoside phosphorylase [Cyclobacteriaceae bacterium]HMV09891.1 nucleoside phosphorylase [Cyclobacteriaceae bacterium]HMV88717.1 nucleoside phosphorylase [Cyclobacteriaceae bacterium]HMW99629.1 nucleoside phosphorylase [Cyclobacteriaceae bacterium]HMX50994.1 nucleoside phosphorylase [Cyclobacteriaceae bacterium]
MPKISETDLILNPDGSVYHLNLLPKHISDTIITVGDPSRVYKVSQHFDDVDFEMNKREFITHVGRYKGKKITVISTGIGTDNVEIFLTEMDALVNIDLKTREPKSRKKKLKIVRIGTSGALQEDIPLGSHLFSNYAVGLDNLMQFYDLPMDEFETRIAGDIQTKTGLPFRPYMVAGSEMLKEQIGFDMISGNTITTPGFYAPQGRVVRAQNKLPKLLDDLNYYHNKSSDFWLTNFEMETAGYYAMARLLGHEALSVNAIIANRIKGKFSKDPDKVIDSLIKKVLERI